MIGHSLGKKRSVGNFVWAATAVNTDCIWLVHEDGKYEQTTERKFLLNCFEIEHCSQEGNFFGERKVSLANVSKFFAAIAW
jgi:hypothetical protein